MDQNHRTTKLFFCKYQIFIHYLGVFQFRQPKQFILFYSRHLDMTVDTGFGDGDLDLEHAIQKCQPRHDKGTTCCGSKFGTWRDTKGNNPKNDKFIGNQIARDCSSPIWTVVKAETCRRCCARDSPRKTPELACLNFSFNWFQRWNLMIFSFACNSALSHYSKVNSWKAFLSRTPSILVLCASYVRSLAQLS
jgi:hypothetical protein